MQTINLDEKLLLTDDSFTYRDEYPNSGEVQGIFGQDHFKGPELTMAQGSILGNDLYATFHVGGWEAGQFHRLVEGGPRVEGPYAWMTPNATVLTAHKQDKRERILVQPGDHVILRGTEYEIVQGRNQHVELKVVA